MKQFIVTKIFAFMVGAIILICFSAFQKIIIGSNPFMIKGYIIPIIFGGVSGLTIVFYKNKWEEEYSRVEREKLSAIIEMAGAVCHEMNQPMQIISGYSQILQSDISEGNPLHPKIQTIKSEIDRMGKITSKLMKITRYETKSYLNDKIIDIDKASNAVE